MFDPGVQWIAGTRHLNDRSLQDRLGNRSKVPTDDIFIHLVAV